LFIGVCIVHNIVAQPGDRPPSPILGGLYENCWPDYHCPNALCGTADFGNFVAPNVTTNATNATNATNTNNTKHALSHGGRRSRRSAEGSSCLWNISSSNATSCCCMGTWHNQSHAESQGLCFAINASSSPPFVSPNNSLGCGCSENQMKCPYQVLPPTPNATPNATPNPTPTPTVPKDMWRLVPLPKVVWQGHNYTLFDASFAPVEKMEYTFSSNGLFSIRRTGYLDQRESSKFISYAASGTWHDLGKWLPCEASSDYSTTAIQHHSRQKPRIYKACRPEKLEALLGSANTTGTGDRCPRGGFSYGDLEPCIARFPSKLQLQYTSFTVTAFQFQPVVDYFNATCHCATIAEGGNTTGAWNVGRPMTIIAQNSSANACPSAHISSQCMPTLWIGVGQILSSFALYNATQAALVRLAPPPPLNQTHCFIQQRIIWIEKEVKIGNNTEIVTENKTITEPNCTSYITEFPPPVAPVPIRTLCLGPLGKGKADAYTLSNKVAMKCRQLRYDPGFNNTDPGDFQRMKINGWLPPGSVPDPILTATWGIRGLVGGAGYNPTAVAICPGCFYERNFFTATGSPICHKTPQPWERVVHQRWIDTSVVLYGLRQSTFLDYDKEHDKLASRSVQDILAYFVMWGVNAFNASNASKTGNGMLPSNSTNGTLLANGLNWMSTQIVVDRVDAKFICHWGSVLKLQVCWDSTVLRFFIQVNSTNDEKVFNQLRYFLSTDTLQKQLMLRLREKETCEAKPSASRRQTHWIDPSKKFRRNQGAGSGSGSGTGFASTSNTPEKGQLLCAPAPPDSKVMQLMSTYPLTEPSLKPGRHPFPDYTGLAAHHAPCYMATVALCIAILHFQEAIN